MSRDRLEYEIANDMKARALFKLTVDYTNGKITLDQYREFKRNLDRINYWSD